MINILRLFQCSEGFFGSNYFTKYGNVERKYFSIYRNFKQSLEPCKILEYHTVIFNEKIRVLKALIAWFGGYKLEIFKQQTI